MCRKPYEIGWGALTHAVIRYDQMVAEIFYILYFDVIFQYRSSSFETFVRFGLILIDMQVYAIMVCKFMRH